MKNVLITLVFLMAAFTLRGQEKMAEPITSGKITYQEKRSIQFTRDSLREMPPQFEGRMPRERKSEKILTFTEEVSLFGEGKKDENDNDREDFGGGQGGPPGGGMRGGGMPGGGMPGGGMPGGGMPGGRSMMFRMMSEGNNSQIFTDFNKNTTTEQREFMNRLFCIDKPVPEKEWKITGNQKTILGYICSEAVCTDSSGVKTVVWFAPALSVRGGPALLINLPGMVLEADIRNGSHTYVATSIVAIPPKELKIKPLKGTKMTEDEYKSMVTEKMKEMEADGTNSGMRAPLMPSM